MFLALSLFFFHDTAPTDIYTLSLHDAVPLANVQNALAAAAAAHAAGAHVHDIRQGLRSFHPSFHEAPGRLNLVEVHGVKVVIDYAHNPHSLAMAGDFVNRLTGPNVNGPQPGRRIAVIASPGDRRDEDMRELGRVAARLF